MYKKFMPIPYESFPNQKEIIDGTNCLAFALGIKNPERKSGEYCLQNKIPIDRAFLEKVKELGFDTRRFRKICTEDETIIKGYIIRVYNFSKVTLSDGTKTEDFHVIRREKIGVWVHKTGFGNYPRQVSITDWIIISSIYGDRFISFAIEG